MFLQKPIALAAAGAFFRLLRIILPAENVPKCSTNVPLMFQVNII